MSKKTVAKASRKRKKNDRPEFDAGANVWCAGVPEYTGATCCGEDGWSYGLTKAEAIGNHLGRLEPDCYQASDLIVGRAVVEDPTRAMRVDWLREKIEEEVAERCGPQEWSVPAKAEAELEAALARWARKWLPTILEDGPIWNVRKGT